MILQNDFQYAKGIVLGRFQVDSKITVELLRKIISSKKELKNIPVIAEADFGHTLPIFTFPVGGEVEIEAKLSGAKMVLTKK
ncbi:MAG: hypothetical protein Q8K60_03570 [Parachlamydiaceae bacterium]|nr:hypothetical protein [Parachlamydiaceae bacterium]